MLVSNMYPSKYISAVDLKGQAIRVTISHVNIEEMTDGKQKPVAYFENAQKGLVLNKTNSQNIAVMHGNDTDQWAGKEVELFSAWVDFQGRTVEAIRVRPPSSNAQQTAPAPAQTPPVNDPAGQGPLGPNPPPAGQDISDEIPF